MRLPAATTRLIALLGDPVAHSLSPALQNAALDHLGLDAVYLALRCDESSCSDLLTGIARAGGAGNVTVPHKQIAARTVERITEAVARTNACNTYWLEDGMVCGDNTDVAGFAAAARGVLGGDPAGARVLLIGAGGAASAAAYALALGRADQVTVLNRSRAPAEELIARFATEGTVFVLASSVGALAGERFDLVVNATSLGIRSGDPLPLPGEADVRIGAALDLVYGAQLTAWVRHLHTREIPAEDGLEMLIQQGAASFARWWGMDPPLDVMRASLPQR